MQNSSFGRSALSKQEDFDMVKCCKQNMTAAQIAIQMGHREGWVYNRLKQMGIRSSGVRNPAGKEGWWKIPTWIEVELVKADGTSIDLAPQKILEEAPISLGVRLMEMEENQCRWITDNRLKLYCGHPKRPGSSYCPHHHRKVYNPPTRATLKRPIPLY